MWVLTDVIRAFEVIKHSNHASNWFLQRYWHWTCQQIPSEKSVKPIPLCGVYNSNKWNSGRKGCCLSKSLSSRQYISNTPFYIPPLSWDIDQGAADGVVGSSRQLVAGNQFETFSKFPRKDCSSEPTGQQLQKKFSLNIARHEGFHLGIKLWLVLNEQNKKGECICLIL